MTDKGIRKNTKARAAVELYAATQMLKKRKRLMGKVGEIERNKKRRIGARQFPYIALLPYFIIYLTFSAFPLIATVGISMTDWTIGADINFVGLKNFLTLFTDKRFLTSLTNIFLFVIVIVPVEILLGLIIASMLTNKKMVGKNVFRVINFLPYLLIPAAAGVIFGQFFGRQTGIINRVLMSLGMLKKPIFWTGQGVPARIMTILIVLWKYCGYTSLFFIAGITNIDTSIYEAADLDGITPVQKMFKITLPLLKPVMKFVGLTTTINTFQLFDELVMLFSTTNGGVKVGGPQNSVLTPIWLMYDTAFSNVPRYGYAAAIAVATFIVISLVSFVVGKITGKEE